jgi:hypothetical protein
MRDGETAGKARRIGEVDVVSNVRRLQKIPREDMDMQLFKGREAGEIEKEGKEVGRIVRKEEGGETERKREERQKGRGRRDIKEEERIDKKRE